MTGIVSAVLNLALAKKAYGCGIRWQLSQSWQLVWAQGGKLKWTCSSWGSSEVWPLLLPGRCQFPHWLFLPLTDISYSRTAGQIFKHTLCIPCERLRCSPLFWRKSLEASRSETRGSCRNEEKGASLDRTTAVKMSYYLLYTMMLNWGR